MPIYCAHFLSTFRKWNKCVCVSLAQRNANKITPQLQCIHPVIYIYCVCVCVSFVAASFFSCCCCCVVLDFLLKTSVVTVLCLAVLCTLSNASAHCKLQSIRWQFAASILICIDVSIAFETGLLTMAHWTRTHWNWMNWNWFAWALLQPAVAAAIVTFNSTRCRARRPSLSWLLFAATIPNWHMIISLLFCSLNLFCAFPLCL